MSVKEFPLIRVAILEAVACESSGLSVQKLQTQLTKDGPYIMSDVRRVMEGLLERGELKLDSKLQLVLRPKEP